MLKLVLVIAIILIAYVQHSFIEAKRGQLVWSDEFDSETQLKANWYPMFVGAATWQGELEYYTRTNYYLDGNGNLIIEAKLEEMGGRRYTSSIIRTYKRFQYGVFEARAKLPRGRGTWPAYWLWTKEQEGGEIDIVEHLGRIPGRIHATLHYNRTITGRVFRWHDIRNEHTEFHNYTLEWSSKHIDIYVDSFKFLSYKIPSEADGPFDLLHHIILNVAVGGDWAGVDGIDDSVFPQNYTIDYVRVYEYLDD